MPQSTTIFVNNLLERMQAGDEQARDELINCAQRRLEILTRRMFKSFARVRRWEDSSDVRQNAMLRLWRALDEVRPANATEFFRLAATNIRRELIDLARHYFGPQGLGAKHESWHAGADSGNAVAPIPNSAVNEDDAHKLAEWTEFHEQVEQLPDDERAAYDLLWYQELKQEEAAKSLGISVWMLQRNYRNAKIRLHNRLPGK